MTHPLLPPAGAEPGSVWLTNIGSAIYWTGTRWEILDRTSSHDPAELWEHGYRLSDPHGAAAAVAVLEAAGFSEYALERDEYHQCRVTLYKDECYPERVIEDGKHPTSFLAAALAAVREWEGRDG